MEEKSCLSPTFVEFLEQNIKNYDQFKCKAAYVAGFGGCLVAKCGIKEGEEVLRIPQSLFITLTIAMEKNVVLLEVSKHLNVQRKSILAFFLFQEMNDKNSFYYQYLNAIPSCYSNTITWSEKEFVLLREELKIKHTKKQQKILQEYLAIKSFLSNYSDQYPQIDAFSEQQFLQLIAMIESRTLFFKNEHDLTSDVGAMIPFYDLANHTFMEGVDHFKYFFFDQIDNSYVMRAYKDFQAEEQIFITYGNYNNEHFLDYYGFIPFNNLREALQFTIQTDQLSDILGKKFIEKLADNSHIAAQLLSHFFSNSTLKPTIVLEVEQSTKQFSWETITFLQVFSLNLDKKIDVSSMPSSFTKNKVATVNLQYSKQKQASNKNDKFQKQQKQQKTTNEKSQLSCILEAFNQNSIESESYYNDILFKEFASKLKFYLLSLYKDIHLDKIEIMYKEIPYTTLLAKEFTEKEISIINACQI